MKTVPIGRMNAANAFRAPVMVAAMVGTVILVCNDVASLGVLGSVATVAGIVAAVGVGRFVLWGRIGICVPTKAVD